MVDEAELNRHLSEIAARTTCRLVPGTVYYHYTQKGHDALSRIGEHEWSTYETYHGKYLYDYDYAFRRMKEESERELDSQSESEPDGKLCEADLLTYRRYGKKDATCPLAPRGCHAASETKVYLLIEDVKRSAKEVSDEVHIDERGRYFLDMCPSHAAIYRASAAARKCAKGTWLLPQWGVRRLWS